MESALVATLLASAFLLLILLSNRFAGVPAVSLAAHRRAEELVQRMLTAAELAQLSEKGYLEVPSRQRPGRVYRVPSIGSPVAVVEPDAPTTYLCLQPVEPLPGREVVLVHKLMLEAAEEEYWRKANVVGCDVPPAFLAARPLRGRWRLFR